MKLTQPIVNGLTLPSGKTDAIFFDDDVPGFGLRLRAGGKRSWIFQYQIGTKQRRMTLGTVPALTLTAARKTAAELHARVKMAEDPAAAKRESQRRANDTVEALLRLFLPEKKQTLRHGSYITLDRRGLRCAKPHGSGALVSRRDISVPVYSASTALDRQPARARYPFFAWRSPRSPKLNPGRNACRAGRAAHAGAVHGELSQLASLQ